MKRLKPYLLILIVSGALTAIICGVMNLSFIPAIENATQGIRCFDMNFGYSYETASRFLSLLSEEGRSIYLTRQLPLDFFYPIAYGVFFSLLLVKLSGRKVAIVLPALLAVCDYCENVCVYKMLTATPLPRALVSIASVATSAKTVLMYLCFLLIIALLVKRIITKRKSAKE